MRSVNLIGPCMLAIVLSLAACTRQPSTDPNQHDVNLTSYNAADGIGQSARAATGTDQAGDLAAMNSWDFDGSAASPPSKDQGLAPTKVDVEDLHSAYLSNAVAAAEKYGSGPFLVTGAVKGIGAEYGKTMVHFQDDDDAVLSDTSGAEKIKPFQSVMLLCQGVKPFESFIELEDCVVQNS